MQFTKIALAAAVTLVAAQAQAATVYLAGASATSANYRSALTSLCSGTATTYTNTSDTNKFAVKCSVNFTGIPGVDAVSFNVSGGSFTAVTTSAGNATDVFVDVAAANPNTALTAARKSEGGFLDIDAAAFPASELANAGLSAAPATSAASFSQVFGVAVSPDLYTALQAAQGLTGCGVDSLTQACQPSITKAQYTSIVSDAFNTAKQDINAILGVGAAGDKLTVCRRVSTSGTQASSNQYFLNAYIGGDGAAAGALAPADQATYGADSGLPSYEVAEGAGTGNARTCLSNAGYAVGVLSLENYPDLTTRSGGQRADRKWRYVKINGVAAYDGNEAVAGKSTASAKAGKYDFWFTSQKYGHTANGTAVVNAIDAKLGTVDLNGLFGNSLSAAKRGSNTSPVTFE
ncbi:MAG: hypothetical protein IIA02_11990 [Proteobacteria bacterium]|uniref:hypothetical protein n=1 Tax=Aquabacterium sp. TaxID=1872578 RepID=UPI0035C770BA|nr:hypothetical protein [Pseudomonadota bacterium]